MSDSNLDKLSIPIQISDFIDAPGKTDSFITENHKKALAAYCKKNHITLSIRQTGEFSIQRIKEGAKAKPHSILEKTIKPSSLLKKYPKITASFEDRIKDSLKESNDLKIKEVHIDEIIGFVGHWSPNGELLGLRLDSNDIKEKSDSEKDFTKEAELTELQKFITIDPATEEPYIKLEDFNSYKESMEGKHAIYLYTGDYDLSEIYKHNKPLVEGSDDKARVLTNINRNIANMQKQGDSPRREGSFKVKRTSKKLKDGRQVTSHLIEKENGSDYAMIQHGDQMGYTTNQINESMAGMNPNDKIEKVKLVRAVSKEPDEPLAWCVKGEWFVTNNTKEHSMLREAKKINTSSAWKNSKINKKIQNNLSRIFKI